MLNSHCKEKKKLGKEDMKCPVGELGLKSWIRWFDVLNKMVSEGFTEKVT